MQNSIVVPAPVVTRVPPPRGAGTAPTAEPRPEPAPGPRPAVPACRVSVAVPGARVVICGRLDVRAAADVRMVLVEALAAGSGELVLDVAGVGAVDATGLGVLVGAHRRAGRSGRSLVLRDPAPALARALLLTRLDRVLAASWTSPG